MKLYAKQWHLLFELINYWIASGLLNHVTNVKADILLEWVDLKYLKIELRISQRLGIVY